MLTRLEVKGFKNLLDVNLDFGAFTCIAGENGIGKSNIFDVIEFLSHLASGTLVEASQRVRGASGLRGGDPRDLFWDGYRDQARLIQLSAEMLVPRVVEDDLGAEAKPATTFLRYDLSLGYEPPQGQGSVGRLSLASENLTHITRGASLRHLKFRHSPAFRNSVVTGERRGGAFLSTEQKENGVVINVHGDGGSRGKPQPRAAARAGRTVLSTVTTNDQPTILAARREMQSWRRLALEPSALRAADDFTSPRRLAENGAHLAASLFRIANEPDMHGVTDSAAVYSRVGNRLADLTGLGVESIEVALDPVREVFTLYLVERGGLRLPARALSEGTLRFLALCVLLEDPSSVGVLCMEEPENGIHPANLPAMLRLVQDLAVDPKYSPDDDNPLRQVIINTHSPGVVQLCATGDLLYARVKAARTSEGHQVRALSVSPFRDSWRASARPADNFSEADVLAYLTAPVGAQLHLPLGLAG